MMRNSAPCELVPGHTPGILGRMSADGLVISEMYGYKNVKWVQRIELVSRPRAGIWEQRGYDVDAWVGRSNGDCGRRTQPKRPASPLQRRRTVHQLGPP